MVAPSDLLRHAEISCAAFYFSKREAVTFNSDGFIGFAGWADDCNVQPILSAFCEWTDDLQKEISAKNVAESSDTLVEGDGIPTDNGPQT